MDCLNDQDLLAVFQRKNPMETALLWHHINGCEGCLELAAYVRLALAATVAPRVGWHGWPTVAGRREVDIRYAMGPEIARGGMGSIIAACDLHLDREVAIKVAGGDALSARRFQREIAITSELEHPAIVPIHDSGTLPDGRPFYVMRLVGGPTLAQRIEEADTAGARLALLPNLIAVSDAVAFAHARGVVHRDLKPHNMLIGEFGESFVLDWGLAKRIDDVDGSPESETDRVDACAQASEATWLPADPCTNTTAIGQAMGTPAYMAPEQRANGVKAALPPCDVYSLGATLQHLLVGVVPTPGANLGDDMRLNTAPLALAAIVKRATAAVPTDRYPTALEFAADLRRFVDGQLVLAHRYTAWQRLRRWCGRHRTALAVAGVAATALLVVSTVALQRIFTEQHATQQANVTAVHQRDAAQKLVNFVLDSLRVPLQSSGRGDLLGDTSGAVLAYYAELPDSPQFARQKIDALLTSAQLALTASESDGALVNYAKAEALLPKMVEGDRELWRCRIGVARASVQLLRGEFAAAEHANQDCIVSAQSALVTQLQPKDELEWRRVATKALIELADVQQQQANVANAIALNERALDMAAPLIAQSDRAGFGHAVRAALNVSNYQRSLRHFAAAQKAATRCLELTRQLLGALPNDILGTYATVGCEISAGMLHEHEGDGPAAIAAYGRAYDAAKQLVAREPNNTLYGQMFGFALEKQARMAVQLRDSKAAEQLFIQSRDVFAKYALAEPHNALAHQRAGSSALALADFYRVNDSNEARAHYEAAIEAYTHCLDAAPASLKAVDQLSFAYTQLMLFERDAGHTAAANAACQKALDLAEVVYGKRPEAMLGFRIATLLYTQIRYDAGDAKTLVPRMRRLAEPVRALSADDVAVANLLKKIDALQR